jgi:CRISPR-associated protein Cas5t
VGSSGNERAKTTFGNKYNITPVRRELLVDLRAVVVMDGNPELEEAVRRGLSGHGDPNRYGLPFVGDNAFLPDRINVLPETPPAFWLEALAADDDELRPRTARLTTWIDRADLSWTRSALYAPTETTYPVVSATSWTATTRP